MSDQESEAKQAVELIKKHVLRSRCIYCSDRWPYKQLPESEKPHHPEFRRGGTNMCDALLRYIIKIEQELDVQPAPSPLATRQKLQTPQARPCCKESHDHQNQEGL